MRVLVTGATGFIGTALCKALAETGRLTASDGVAAPIAELLLADRVPASAPSAARCATRTLTGDMADPAFVEALAALAPDSIFHLAASLTLDAERDAAAAYRVNVEPLRALIESRPGSAQRVPTFVFASSIAVFGGDLPPSVDDHLRAEPDTTYGTHKAIAELLLADYSRKGLADARALRLPVVLLRGGAATPTVSDRIAAIVREPLAGRDVVCGLAPDTRLPVASAQAVARALIALHDAPRTALPHAGALNLPALTVSVAEMVDAVRRIAGDATAARVRFAPDAALQRIVDGWPREFTSAKAAELGLGADRCFDDIVDAYLAHARG